MQSSAPGGLGAALNRKCPRCRKGDLFRNHFVKFIGFNHMYERCPHCHLKYEVEPGFFQGAMYVSYAIQVAVVLPIIVITIAILDLDYIWIISAIIGVIVLIIPVNYQLSRSLYLHGFGNVRYHPDLYYQKSEEINLPDPVVN